MRTNTDSRRTIFNSPLLWNILSKILRLDSSLQVLYMSCYFRDLYNRVELELCDKDDPSGPPVTVPASKMWKYDQIVKQIGHKIGYDPQKIQLFKTQHTVPGRDPHIGNAVPLHPEVILSQVIGLGSLNQQRPGIKVFRLFYQKVSTRAVSKQIESKKLHSIIERS